MKNSLVLNWNPS